MVDYQAKYESLLHNVLSDLNSEVLTAQGRAEKNAEASGAYCSELKERLREKERELEESRAKLLQLKQELSSQLSEARGNLEFYVVKDKPLVPNPTTRREIEQPIAADSTCMSGDCHVTNSVVMEFLGGLAGLSVSRCVHSSSSTTFHCEVTDGALNGHRFSLTLDSTSHEFTYHPLQLSPSVPPDSMLADTACFPDYMQSRFLLNLLNTTFIQPDS